MTIDELFLLTLEDLEGRVPLGRGQYDALMSAALLRKLMLDDVPLIDAANRAPRRRLKIRYEMEDIQPTPGYTVWTPNGMFYPGTSGHPNVVSLGRDAFLAHPILVVYGETITVRELVKFMANVQGAVHLSRASGAKDEALWDYMWGSRVTGPEGMYSGGIHDLIAIGKIVLLAVADLRRVVETAAGWPHLPDFAKGLHRVDDPSTRGW
jgi:hypothetical protein